LDYGKELDRHYIGSRYPNFYPAGAPYTYYTKEMGERCVNYAELIKKMQMGKTASLRKLLPGVSLSMGNFRKRMIYHEKDF